MAQQDAGDPSAIDVLRSVSQRHADLGMESDRLESLSVLALALQDAGDGAGRWRWSSRSCPRSTGRHLPAWSSPAGSSPTSTASSRPPATRARRTIAARAAAYLSEQSEQIRDDDLRARFLAAPVNVRLAAWPRPPTAEPRSPSDADSSVPCRRGPGAPTGTVTLLFSDIEGSTSLLRRLGEDYADALSASGR
jgi:hypothetical protein